MEILFGKELSGRYSCKLLLQGGYKAGFGDTRVEALQELSGCVYNTDLDLVTPVVNIYVYNHIENTFMVVSGDNVTYGSTKQSAIIRMIGKLKDVEIQIEDME